MPTPSCQHCGAIHPGVCPRIKSIEYHADGVTVRKIEYHPPQSRIPFQERSLWEEVFGRKA